MKILFPAGAVALAAATAFAAQSIPPDLRETALAMFKPLPFIPEVTNNPSMPERIALGKALFFDPRLSSSGVFSCNSCHNLATGGDDNRETSIGHGWQKGQRNAPTVFNSVFNKSQFWDGRAEDLKAQAKGPIQAGAEMANTSHQVVETFKSMPQYVEWFRSAFPREADPLTFDNLATALADYEATLVTPAPFDAYLNGDDTAIGPEAKQGLALFIEKGCSSCHSGVNLGGDGYYPFGLVEKPSADILPENDKGRFAVTSVPEDSYVFRVPSLRNVAITAPYFHSGKVWDLREAVAIMGTTQLGQELTHIEIDQIVAYLHSLTGKRPEITYPILPPETPGTPRPRS
ncbi:cytochrome-c peroxidase [Mesorhizobium ciceri]|uniref:cytochrome-c peroxidase n=1 Tax=Mesorhizobium TaxID=68287 RepID=UPI0007A94F7A|nr:cytochrome-c peroxidase [Mesorhizobium ciceri]AMX98955.1 cytochrome C peroxidase [Mesorhizobium ciceri biovar biserrulae]